MRNEIREAARLRLTAELAGVPAVGSTKDLTMGQAGRVIGALRNCATQDDLYGLARPWWDQPEPPRRRGLLAALAAILTGA